MIDADEVAARRRLGVPGTNRHPATPLDDAEPKRTQLEHGRLTLLIVRQVEARDIDAVDRQPSRQSVGANAIVGEGDRSGLSRPGTDHDLAIRRGADAVGAGPKPVEARQRQPTGIAPERGVALRPPGLNDGAVGVPIRHRARKIRVGLVPGPIRTYVARPPSTGLVATARLDAVVPSNATAIGPSPKRARHAAV